MDHSPHKTRRMEIRQFIVAKVRENAAHLTETVKNNFKISRQAAFKHVNTLVKEGYLNAKGKTNNRTYELGAKRFLRFKTLIDSSASEDLIWSKNCSPLFQGLKNNVLHICEYGVTEMINNAIDHSEGKHLEVIVEISPKEILIRVNDDGIGIFNKIQRELKLPDPKLSILELAKGKYTTDPKRHSGEGVFFTSKIFDYFMIQSEGLVFSHGINIKFDALLNVEDAGKNGTHVTMVLDPLTRRTTKAVFDEFTDKNLTFDKTIVPVELAKFEEGNLVSRSQGKRLVARFEKFKNVILDFKNVNTIGRPFADEVFRVFPSEHKNTHLMPVNANKGILDTIKSMQSGNAI